MSPNLSALPTWLWVVFGVLALAQLTLLIIAGIDLIRRPTYSVTGRRKWPWAVLILALNTIGPILYLVLGRRRDRARTIEPEGFGHGSVADSLYGARPGYPPVDAPERHPRV